MDQKAKIDTVVVAFSVKKLNELKHEHVENDIIFKDSDRPQRLQKPRYHQERLGGLHNSSMPDIFRY